MSTELGLTEMVQAKSDQRIVLQAVCLDRIVAGFAEAILAGIDSLKSGVDFREEIVEVVGGDLAGSCLNSGSPFGKLGPGPLARAGGIRLPSQSPPRPIF